MTEINTSSFPDLSSHNRSPANPTFGDHCTKNNPQDICYDIYCDSKSCRAIKPTGNTSAVKQFIAVVSIAALTACGVVDPYAVGFDRVAIGDTRSRVIDVLGPPASMNSIEVPLVKVEQLTWRAHLNGRVYVVHTVWDRVASKSVLQ